MLRSFYRNALLPSRVQLVAVRSRPLSYQTSSAGARHHSASVLATNDTIIPVHEARALLQYAPQCRLFSREGFGWTGIAAVAMMSCSLSIASCQQQRTTDEESRSSDVPNNEDDDPYDNLPDEDDETTCSMCQTFRKGPCRPQWRKLERCFKDHEGEENGAVKCMRYFNPHHQCLAKYTNLYQLVSLEAKQGLVQDIQKSVSQDECRSWEPEIDWTMWKRFCTEDNGLSMKPQAMTSKDKPYWQRIPENTEPLLITLTSNLPQRDADGLLLKVGYAVDQDGIVIGLSFNSEYGKLMDEANKTTSDDKGDNLSSLGTSDNAPQEALTSPSHLELEFFALPGATKKVRVLGLYSENPVLAKADKEVLDATLYKSRAYSLSKVAKEATK